MPVSPPDASSAHDGGGVLDASALDTSTRDASALDASTRDASSLDASFDARIADAQPSVQVDAGDSAVLDPLSASLRGRTFILGYTDYLFGPLIFGEHTYSLSIGTDIATGTWSVEDGRAVLRGDAGKAVPDRIGGDFACSTIDFTPIPAAPSAFTATCHDVYRDVGFELIEH